MKTKLNVKLLRKIQKHILAEPKRFIMGWWNEKSSPGEPLNDFEMCSTIPKCGTAACIGGWALILSGENPDLMRSVSKAAGALLGIENDAANRLFDSYAWPNRFRRFRELKSPAARVKVAVARIDHFIKTNGAE